MRTWPCLFGEHSSRNYLSLLRVKQAQGPLKMRPFHPIQWPVPAQHQAGAWPQPETPSFSCFKGEALPNSLSWYPSLSVPQFLYRDKDDNINPLPRGCGKSRHEAEPCVPSSMSAAFHLVNLKCSALQGAAVTLKAVRVHTSTQTRVQGCVGNRVEAPEVRSGRPQDQDPS